MRDCIIDLLGAANAQRNAYWDPEGKLSPLFFATELAGEIGEACNIVKKLERERLGLRGSRSTIQNLGFELADGVICTSLLANSYQLDLRYYIRTKFNQTSAKLNLPVFIP